MLKLEFAQLSDPGSVREQNEDYLGCVTPYSPEQARSHGWLFALADGVGGHECGEIASRAAVENLLAGFRAAPAGEPHPTLLPRLVQSANAHVIDTSHVTRQNGAPMATTLVACALRFDRVVVAHVGDSRCYLVQGGKAAALTRDHTFANEQVRIGVLSARDAAESPIRHVLSRSLGNDLFVNVDISDNQIFPGDVLMLCSDGLHGALASAEIAAEIEHAESLDAAAGNLVGIAKERDGGDNISVQLIRVLDVERMGMYRGRYYKLR